MIASLNSSMEQIKSTEEMISPLSSAIEVVNNDKTTNIKIDDDLFKQFKSGIDNYVLIANNRTNEAISSENMRNTSTILIFTAYLIVIVLIFLSFFMKRTLFSDKIFSINFNGYVSLVEFIFG